MSKMTHQTRIASIGLMTAMLFSFLTSLTLAQEKSEKPPEGAQVKKQGESAAKTEEEEEKFPELEAVASEKFRSLSLVVPIYKGLNIEGHYFGVKPESEGGEEGEHGSERRRGIVDAAAIGGSWSFRLGEHFVLSPGFGVFFGEGQKTSPAFTFRWEFEKGRFFSQGLFVQSFQESEEFGRVSIWDGNHVSVRFRRLQVGPTWERIHTRKENEWKGGGRAAFKILPNLSFVCFVLAPKTEFRGGFIIHPKR